MNLATFDKASRLLNDIERVKRQLSEWHEMVESIKNVIANKEKSAASDEINMWMNQDELFLGYSGSLRLPLDNNLQQSTALLIAEGSVDSLTRELERLNAEFSEIK